MVYLIFEIFMFEYSVYTVSSIPCPQIFQCPPTSFKTIISSLILLRVCGECVLCMSVCVWCEWYVCVCCIQTKLSSVAWMYMYLGPYAWDWMTYGGWSLAKTECASLSSHSLPIVLYLRWSLVRFSPSTLACPLLLSLFVWLYF